jgi:D-serine deaminase-like pyridoxal phosphate-dependent protein
VTRRPATADLSSLDEATRDLDPPFAAVDLDALSFNADAMVARSGGHPIRLASKSVRCRSLIAEVGQRPGFAGVMAYSLREAIWLAENGTEDILVAYPSVDRAAWHRLSSEPLLAATISVIVDSVQHLDVIDAARAATDVELRLCLDIDCSLHLGPAHLGVRRSPLHSPAEATLVAAAIVRRRGMRLVGVMFYDAQIAGLPDSSPLIRRVKAKSDDDLRSRRAAVVEAVGAHAELEIVNGGGTGSLHVTGRDKVLTELAAGSGLYGPTLFDGYRDFTPRPAAFFALSVVRRPSPSHATLFAGGYIASGPAGSSRVPRPYWPRGLRLLGTEGAGEVQTPVRGRAASSLRVGDRVWLRHAKAGEYCERFDELHLISAGVIVETVPTYRGEGRNFG